MFRAYGLHGHIRNNDLRATALLAGFAVYVGMLWCAFCLLFAATGLDMRMVTSQFDAGHHLNASHEMFALRTAEHVAIAYAWVPALLSMGWLAYAYLERGRLVRESTGAQFTARSLEPELYNLVETLAIGAGMPMPAIEIIETDALNAYASGWTPADSVVGVTRGLLRSLSKGELEAVLAHEITHIRCRDVRLMTVAAIFVGFLASGSRMLGAGKSGARTRSLLLRTSGAAGMIFVAGAAVVGVLAWVLGLLSQFALSRTREFVADAGAVELTKNPDALISALRKISAQSEMPDLPTPLRPMMIASPFDGWLATHPSIESRISALEMYAGDRSGGLASEKSRLRHDGASSAGIASQGPNRTFGRRASGALASRQQFR